MFCNYDNNYAQEMAKLASTLPEPSLRSLNKSESVCLFHKGCQTITDLCQKILSENACVYNVFNSIKNNDAFVAILDKSKNYDLGNEKTKFTTLYKLFILMSSKYMNPNRHEKQIVINIQNYISNTDINNVDEAQLLGFIRQLRALR